MFFRTVRMLEAGMKPVCVGGQCRCFCHCIVFHLLVLCLRCAWPLPAPLVLIHPTMLCLADLGRPASSLQASHYWLPLCTLHTRSQVCI